MPTTILVLGATGRTGRRVVSVLAEQGHTVRAASRTPRSAHGPVTPVHFDWTDPATYRPAIDGVDAIYQVLQPDSADPTDEVAALLDDAAAVGVRRVVHVSNTTAHLSGEDFPMHRVERLLETGPVPATILRPNVFDENFSEHPTIVAGIRAGVVAVPAGQARVAPISVEDIAAVAAAALTQDGHQHKTYSLTGPDSLSFADMTAIVADAAGKPVRYQAITPTEFREAILAGGAPAHIAEFYAIMYEGIRNGWAADVSADVEQITGRPPVSFGDYVRATAPVWR
ncbi:NmrA family NAD(P)-binding protein [Nocardia sp. NPDC059239]|uniref:NmrA family NAD(P)-binding protein n=1 Tax=Nocardia sp. NPDC059239 TaxID=3346785 RepID=UPI0036751860